MASPLASGMVRFIQQFDVGRGDYAKERSEFNVY